MSTPEPRIGAAGARRGRRGARTGDGALDARRPDDQLDDRGRHLRAAVGGPPAARRRCADRIHRRRARHRRDRGLLRGGGVAVPRERRYLPLRARGLRALRRRADRVARAAGPGHGACGDCQPDRHVSRRVRAWHHRADPPGGDARAGPGGPGVRQRARHAARRAAQQRLHVRQAGAAAALRGRGPRARRRPALVALGAPAGATRSARACWR